jgi:hypothetical protein
MRLAWPSAGSALIAGMRGSTSVKKWLSIAACFAALAAQASTRTALVAAGHCDDPDLIEHSKELTRVLRARVGAQLIDRAELIEHLGVPAARLPGEIERRIEGAELQYFEADYRGAERRLLDALGEIERLAPGVKRWQLFVRGVLLRALILRATSRSVEADEQFRRVLRLDADHRLDSDSFPPSARTRFDRLRGQVASQPRATLAVTSIPAGADVYLDGRAVKRTTPISLEVVPGRYSISLSKDGGFSFSRAIEVTTSASVHFDLEFESSFQPQVVPCVRDGGDEPLRLTNATKLGGRLSIEQVVIARTEQRSAGYTWVSAAVVQVATGLKIREGGVKVDSSDTASSLLGELAEFISTGKAGRNIVASTRGLAPSTTELAAVEQPKLASVATPPLRQGKPPGSLREWPRVLGTGLVGLGTLAVGTGIVFQLRSDQGRAELNRYYAEGRIPAVADFSTVQSIRRRADSQRRSAFAGYALGVAAVSAGAFLILNRSALPDPQPAVSVGVLPGAMSIHASWK